MCVCVFLLVYVCLKPYSKHSRDDCCVVLQCYGLTETSGPITLCDGVKSKYHLSIGRLIPLMEAQIVDIRTGKALPPNKYGELRVRGPPVMQGIVYDISMRGKRYT